MDYGSRPQKYGPAVILCASRAKRATFAAPTQWLLTEPLKPIPLWPSNNRSKPTSSRRCSARTKDALRALRAIKSLILLEETKEGSNGTLSADDEIKLLTKAASSAANRPTSTKTRTAKTWPKTNWPNCPSLNGTCPSNFRAEIRTKLQEIIACVGAAGPGDRGKVMGAATKEFAGQADNKVISASSRNCWRSRRHAGMHNTWLNDRMLSLEQQWVTKAPGHEGTQTVRDGQKSLCRLRALVPLWHINSIGYAT
jgi:uncharacterized protein YqeY